MLAEHIREGFEAYSVGAAASRLGLVLKTEEVTPFETTPI
jgi:hypothetical protein